MTVASTELSIVEEFALALKDAMKCLLEGDEFDMLRAADRAEKLLRDYGYLEEEVAR